MLNGEKKKIKEKPWHSYNNFFAHANLYCDLWALQVTFFPTHLIGEYWNLVGYFAKHLKKGDRIYKNKRFEFKPYWKCWLIKLMSSKNRIIIVKVAVPIPEVMNDFWVEKTKEMNCNFVSLFIVFCEARITDFENQNSIACSYPKVIQVSLNFTECGIPHPLCRLHEKWVEYMF